MTLYVHLDGVLRYLNQPAANAARNWAQDWALAHDASVYKSDTIKPIADLHNIPATPDGGCTREITLDMWVMVADGTLPDELEPLYNEIRGGVYLTTGCGSTIAMAGQDWRPDHPEEGGKPPPLPVDPPPEP